MPPLWWHHDHLEKRKPTYDLAAIKAVLGEVDTLSITTSALWDATALGFDRAGIAKVIRSTKPGMFYKSMTTHADHRVWQGVYHVSLEELLDAVPEVSGERGNQIRCCVV